MNGRSPPAAPSSDRAVRPTRTRTSVGALMASNQGHRRHTSRTTRPDQRHHGHSRRDVMLSPRGWGPATPLPSLLAGLLSRVARGDEHHALSGDIPIETTRSLSRGTLGLLPDRTRRPTRRRPFVRRCARLALGMDYCLTTSSVPGPTLRDCPFFDGTGAHIADVLASGMPSRRTEHASSAGGCGGHGGLSDVFMDGPSRAVRKPGRRLLPQRSRHTMLRCREIFSITACVTAARARPVTAPRAPRAGGLP